jgi:hypothetical protein
MASLSLFDYGYRACLRLVRSTSSLNRIFIITLLLKQPSFRQKRGACLYSTSYVYSFAAYPKWSNISAYEISPNSSRGRTSYSELSRYLPSSSLFSSGVILLNISAILNNTLLCLLSSSVTSSKIPRQVLAGR